MRLGLYTGLMLKHNPLSFDLVLALTHFWWQSVDKILSFTTTLYILQGWAFLLQDILIHLFIELYWKAVIHLFHEYIVHKSRHFGVSGFCRYGVQWRTTFDDVHLKQGRSPLLSLSDLFLCDFYSGRTINPLVYGFSAKYGIYVVWDFQQVLDILPVCYISIHLALTVSKIEITLSVVFKYTGPSSGLFYISLKI